MNIVGQHLEKLLKQKETHLWDGYVNMLKTLKSVFLSYKHWILEFLQNAEDAKAKKISIRLEKDSLWILNDGIVFNDDDFYTICDVNSRKLPSLGFRGYIGIGFKSIFRITDQIHIHSGNFHFMFNKNYWDDSKRKGISISKWPWEILPLEISPENLPEGYTTGFYVPFQNTDGQKILQEIENFLISDDFPKEVILLLKNICVIEVQTPQSSFTITKKIEERQRLSAIETQETIVVKKGRYGQSWAEEARYLLFCKNVPVPITIQQDEETERVRRSDVPQREIGLVFGLDSGKNLQSLVGKLAGVYSFLPLEGEQTGLPFGIFGDFIPQPGRDIINYLAKWNHWMRDEVRDFFKKVIQEVFLPHRQWRFFPAELLERLGYSSVYGPGKEFWEIGLRDPIKTFLESGFFYIDEEETPCRLDELIAVEDEIVQVVGKNTLKKILGPRKIVHPQIKSKIQSKIGGSVDRYDLLHRKEVLEDLKSQPEKLAACYRLIGRLSDYYIQGRQGRDIPLSAVPFILGNDSELYPPPCIVMMEIDVDYVPKFLLALLSKEEKHLHPEIAKDNEAVRQLKRCGLKIVNEQTVMWELEKVVNSITNPQKCPDSWKYPDTLIEATLFLIAHKGRPTLQRLIAHDETLQAPKNLFVPDAPLDWTSLWKNLFLPGFQPVHEKYFVSTREGEFSQYFKELGVHGFLSDDDKPLIETAAYEVTKKRLAEKGHHVVPVTERHKLGYDLQCQAHCEKVFEVKGMNDPHDIELQENAFTAAEQKLEDYILVCVYNLPATPNKVGYKEIPNPTSIWRPVEKARVPKDKWLRA